VGLSWALVRRRVRFRAAWPLVVLAIGATLTACGGFGTPAPTSAPPTSAAPSASASLGASANASANPSVAGDAAAPGAAPALKTVSFVSPGAEKRPITYTLEITGLHRRGPFMVLEGRLTCTKGNQFDTCDGEFVVSGGPSANLNTAAGIMLLDPVGKKEYLVVTDGKDRPYASKLDPSLPLGIAYPFYVNYPAPPQGVTSLTVVLPGGGQPQITDVPVS
jgi:hypothetical protein